MAETLAIVGVLAIGMPTVGIVVDSIRTRMAVRRRLNALCADRKAA